MINVSSPMDVFLELLDKCSVPFDIPHMLSTNNTKLDHIINEGETFEYDCVHGYARMTNVTCQHGSLTAIPLCEPSAFFDQSSFSFDRRASLFFSENCTTHPYWIKNGYVKYQNRRHGGHAEYSVRHGDPATEGEETFHSQHRFFFSHSDSVETVIN